LTGLDMILKTKNRSEELSNDVNLKFDLTSSNYKNVLRRIDMPNGELSGGTRVLSLDFNADYMFSEKLNIKLYYQYSINKQHNNNTGHTRSNTKFGLSFNFTIL
jgi:cell surface protein SprA